MYTEDRHPQSHEDLVTAHDVAEHFRVHPRTPLRWARAGLVPHVRVGMVIRFRLSEVEAALTHGRSC